LLPGTAVTGPAVVELPTTTIVVRPGQRLTLNAFRSFVVEPDAGTS
jgi:N-methylhydantoinase A/oxoprolinase/acetone carboxylase beta subunit